MWCRIFIIIFLITFFVPPVYPQVISEDELVGEESGAGPAIIVEEPKMVQTTKPEEVEKESSQDIYSKYLKDGTPHTKLNQVQEQINSMEGALLEEALKDKSIK